LDYERCLDLRVFKNNGLQLRKFKKVDEEINLHTGPEGKGNVACEIIVELQIVYSCMTSQGGTP
jgi:hypothetical protein